MELIDYFLNYDATTLSRLNDISQIITSILTLITIIITIIFFVIQRVLDQKKQAVKIGIETEQILVQIAFIDSVLNVAYPQEYRILLSANKREMRCFESFEIDKVFGKNQQKALRKLFENNPHGSKQIGGPVLIFHIPSKEENSKIYEELLPIASRYASMRMKITDADPTTDYGFLLHRVIIDTLNKLETLGMMMRKNVADEKTVYVSAGDQFLNFIGAMFYYISSTNNEKNLISGKKNTYDKNRKKMKNVIWIFNKWIRRNRRSKWLYTKLVPLLRSLAFICSKLGIFKHWANRWLHYGS